MLINDLTPTAIAHANQMLDWLADRMTPAWLEVLTNALGTESELHTAVATVRRRLVEAGVTEPIGAIAEGTGTLGAELGLVGEDVQRSARLLKESARVVQAGRGRGKALVVLSTAPISISDFSVDDPNLVERTPRVAHMRDDPTPSSTEHALNVPFVLRQIRDAYVEMEHRCEQLQAQTHQLSTRIAELEAAQQAWEHERSQLHSQLATQTWA